MPFHLRSRFVKFRDSLDRLKDSALKLVKKRKYLGSSGALHAHLWGSYLFFIFFLVAEGDWILDNNLICLDQSTGSPIPEQYETYCQSYHYSVGNPSGEKEVSVLYRFFPWLLLLLSGIYGSVRGLNYLLLGYRIHRIMQRRRKAREEEELEREAGRRPSSPSSKDFQEHLTEFLADHVGSCSRIYWASVGLHLLALLVNLQALYLLNYASGGRLYEALADYPWRRDAEGFRDPLSMAFPPFVRCDVDERTHVVGLGGRYYGCVDTAADLYEKMTLAALAYVGAVVVLTALRLLYLLLVFPFCRRRRSRGLAPCAALGRCGEALASWASLGDLMVLEHFRSQLTGPQYRWVLRALGARSRALPEALVQARSPPQVSPRRPEDQV